VIEACKIKEHIQKLVNNSPKDFPRHFKTFCDSKRQKRRKKNLFYKQKRKQGAKHKQPKRQGAIEKNHTRQFWYQHAFIIVG
jgi:hypothetical protein